MSSLKDGPYTIANAEYTTGTFPAELSPQDDDYVTLKSTSNRWDVKWDEERSAYTITHHTSRRLLDLSEESLADGTRAVITPISQSRTQAWLINPTITTDQYQVLNDASGFALKASKVDETYKVFQTEINTKADEQWVFTPIR